MSDEFIVKQTHEESLSKKQNVNGVGVGVKWVDGKPTDQTAIIIFVEKKLNKKGIIRKYSSEELIPDEIDGIPTDVIEVGKIQKQNFKARVRPVKPGYSCGHQSITAGTIGGLFIDRDGDPVILSNNHVLSCENNAKIGDIICQPGPSDSNNINFIGWDQPAAQLPYIGTLKKFVELNRQGNTQDSAIALIHDKFIQSGMVDPFYPVINQSLAGFDSPKINMQVQKMGRTTGYTTGRIIALNSSFTISYDFGDAKFNDCVVCTSMSKGGDSVGGGTELYYKVNGKLNFGTIEQMYQELEVDRWLDSERFVPKDLIEVLSTTDLRIYKNKIPTRCVWRKVNWLYKHFTNKRLFKIWTRDHREIIITEDHSLFGNARGPNYINTEISGNNIKIGTKILVPSTLNSVGDSKSTGIDTDLLTIIGLFLGDGSYEYRKLSGTKKLRGISISCGGNKAIMNFIKEYILNNDEYLTSTLLARKAFSINPYFDRKELANKLNVKINTIHAAISNNVQHTPKICYMNKKGDIRISNKKLAHKLQSFGIEHGFATKSIPNNLMTASYDEIRALLKGLFSSDGGVKFKNNSRPTIAFTVYNKKLAEQCRLLLWRLGIECGLSHCNTLHSGYKASSTTSYSVTIAGKQALLKFIDKIGLIGHGDKIQKVKEIILNSNEINRYELTTKTVRGIEEQFIKQPVYDLSVEGERFIANGFVCHNSGSIIFDMNMRAVSLLFAGSPKVTIGTPIQPVVDYYGLSLWNSAPVPSMELDDGQWTLSRSMGTITPGPDSIKIISPSNCYCFFQRTLPSFSEVKVTVNTGTDKGATWGPGVSIVWPNGIMKINLRYKGSFAGVLNGVENLNIGKVESNKEYTLRFRKTNTSYIGEVQDNNKWYTVIEVPISLFPTSPLYLVIGKTNEIGYAGDHATIGDVGECTFRDLNVK